MPARAVSNNRAVSNKKNRREPNAMARKKLLLSRTLPQAVEARASRDYDAILNPADVKYDATTLGARAAGCDAVMVCASDTVDAAAITALPDSVRIIATFSVGFDHIDLAAAKAKGLVVTNTPEVLTDATADLALLLLLGAARRASEGERLMRAKAWTGWTPTHMMGTHVTGKAIGILGMGRIGRAFAQRCRGFDMTIHYSDMAPLPPETAQGAIFHADPDAMLPVVDFLSLHAPNTPQTRHFVNADRIATMKDGVVIVNSARGPLVDDDSLIAALASGKVAAAGLDVFQGEPAVDPRYADLENTFLLPHLGSATVETRTDMGFRALDNLDAYFAGREPGDRVV